MVNKFVGAETGTPVPDAGLSLMTYLSTNWAAITPGISPAAADIKFDTKNSETKKFYKVLVRKIPFRPRPIEIGGTREMYEERKRVVLYAETGDAFAKVFTMRENVYDLINANRRALIASGVKEMRVTEIGKLDPESEDGKILFGMANEINEKRAAEYVLVTMLIEKVRVTV